MLAKHRAITFTPKPAPAGFCSCLLTSRNRAERFDAGLARKPLRMDWLSRNERGSPHALRPRDMHSYKLPSTILVISMRARSNALLYAAWSLPAYSFRAAERAIPKTVMFPIYHRTVSSCSLKLCNWFVSAWMSGSCCCGGASLTFAAKQ